MIINLQGEYIDIEDIKHISDPSYRGGNEYTFIVSVLIGTIIKEIVITTYSKSIYNTRDKLVYLWNKYVHDDKSILKIE